MPSRSSIRPNRGSGRKSFAQWLTALAILATLVLAVVYRPQPAPPQVQPVASLHEIDGRILVRSGDIRILPDTGLDLLAGDSVRSEEGASARVAWGDGGELVLDGTGEIILLSGERRDGVREGASLSAGNYRFEWSPGDPPLSLLTPHARIIPGGDLVLEVATSGTRLQVLGGHAQVEAETGPEHWLLTEGERAVISPWGAILVEELDVPEEPAPDAPSPEPTPAPEAPTPAQPTPEPAPAEPERAVPEAVQPSPEPEIQPPPEEIDPNRAALGMPALRDPAQWPFATDSPWNTPLGEFAKLERIRSPYLKLLADLPVLLQSRTVGHTRTADPARRFRAPRRSSIRWPYSDALQYRGSEQRPVTLLHHDRKMGLEFFGLRPGPRGTLAVEAMERFDLKGPGIPPHTRGLAEWGGPSIAGLIRREEWRRGIFHAVALLVPPAALNRRAASGRPFVWPAGQVHPEWRSLYGNEGNLHLGSLLALPADLDLATLNLAPDGPTHRLAQALQRYGGYIVGSSVESGSETIYFLQETAEDWNRIEPIPGLERVWARLEVVTNHSRDRPGGGGPPRMPSTPPFATEEQLADPLGAWAD